MKKKIDDLTINELTWFVALAINHTPKKVKHDCGEKIEIEDWNKPDTRVNGYRFMPCDDWEHGGSIIEKEKIHLKYSHYSTMWTANVLKRNDKFYACAKTPLLAAMRAFVAATHGSYAIDLQYLNKP